MNVPLIDYTIECLASSGIELIYIFCCSHTEQIQEHLNDIGSQWAGVTFKIVVSSSAKSVGDALRRVNDENVIESDFVLVQGDVVGHLALQDILLQHRLRKEKDPTVLMTTVYKRATPSHATRSLEDDTILGLTSDNRILFWENEPSCSTIEIDPMLIMNEGAVKLHYDMLDTHVDICSVEVLQLFKENFDYSTVRNDFMTGVLGDDITEHKLFAHIVQNEYAARVKDVRTYASVARDVIHRWASPVVIDNPLLDPTSSYRLTKGHIYRERNVKLHPRARVGQHCVLGEGSVVGAKTKISRSVIGRGCVIGENCTITNSFLWPGVVIGNNCNIEWGILCDNVHVYDDVVIGKGAILAMDVRVGPNITLKAHTRLVKEHLSADVLGFSMDKEDLTRNIDLGNKGKGVLWTKQEDSALLDLGLHMSAKKDSLGEVYSDEEVINEIAIEDEVTSELEEAILLTDFDVEVREIVLEGLKMGSQIDNMALEINGRKFAHDKTFFECAKCILWAFLASVPEGVEEGKPLLLEIQKILKKWSELLKKNIQSEIDQAELIWALQEFLEKEKEFTRYHSIFQFILHALYDLDIVEEDAIWEWEEEQKQQSTISPFLTQSLKFLEWLREAESSSEE